MGCCRCCSPSWFIGVLLLVSESIQSLGEPAERVLMTWLKMIAVALGVSMVIALVFWIWNAAGLISLGRVAAQTVDDILSQVKSSEGILTTYYIHVFLIGFRPGGGFTPSLAQPCHPQGCIQRGHGSWYVFWSPSCWSHIRTCG